MDKSPVRILLADDDIDDCDFFSQALQELPFSSELQIVHNGEELLKTLKGLTEHLAMLFLDLNLPRRNGIECMEEIKRIPALTDLPVVIFSTSFELKVINQLYEKGARYYARKPATFTELKQVIFNVTRLTLETSEPKTSRHQFVLNS